jgi:CrcB protein
MSGWLWLAVAALGALGACARFVADALIGAWRRSRFPLGTFAVNVSGSFALGLLSGAGAGGDLALLAGTATLGSYTTFSTWMFETHRLGEDGELAAGARNALGCLAAGVAAAALGRAIAGAL